jgi:stage V sporulation protein R
MHLRSFLEVLMSDWTLADLEKWDEKICQIAQEKNLDWYPITYETCDYYEMIGNMSYHGMPTHYGHWSYGKSFEIQQQQYKHGMMGLPYELIINSDPCISYLMKENPLYLQILIMAHCVGHSDFFKNNRTFMHTRADTVVPRMRNAKKRIRSYIEDPSIGIERVEKIIDACHALSYQVPRRVCDIKDISGDREKYLKNIKNETGLDWTNISKIPHEPEDDILGFISLYNKNLEDWEIDIIEIIRDEAYYFMPQIRTKVMNEGWASFWHYNILHDLELESSFHIPFLKSHNQVVRPHIGGLNPYHIGFHMFNKIKERFGMEECFLAREIHNDESFLRQYLTAADCEELNLFTYSKNDGTMSIDDISDEQGWQEVKKEVINSVAGNSIPKIYIEAVDEGDILVLHHEHDGRDLQLQYAEHVLSHVKYLWGNEVKLITMLSGEPYEI